MHLYNVNYRTLINIASC